MTNARTPDLLCCRCLEVIINIEASVRTADGVAHNPCSHVPKNCTPIIKWMGDAHYLVGWERPKNSRKPGREDLRAIPLEQPLRPRTPAKTKNPLKGIPKKQRRRERMLVKAWKAESDRIVDGGGLPLPLAHLIGIPPERIGAYYAEMMTPEDLQRMEGQS